MENPGTNENQGVFNCHEGRKKCFYFISCLYLACSSELLTLLNAISWSKEVMQMQHRALALDKMKIEPAMIHL